MIPFLSFVSRPKEDDDVLSGLQAPQLAGREPTLPDPSPTHVFVPLRENGL